jgi:hypothetical protein
MKKLSPIVLGLSLAVACSAVAAAQDTASVPKVLQITREFIKPGKAGAMHDRSESAFVQAMARAKSPTHYVAMNSLSGKSRALYFTGFDSFAAWEKDNKSVDKNVSLSAELEHASIADGDLLASMDQAVFTYDEDLSYRPHADMSQARFMEITEFHVRLGHGGDWHKLAKMVKDAHEKAGDSAHWAMFEVAYGAEDGTYLALSGDKSMADIDTGYSEDKKFHDAMGEDGMKKLDELYGATVESAVSELFQINPHQSYVSEDWMKADPDFWKLKPAAAPAPAAKPAEPAKKAAM